ncbi:(d)CMP kinase [Planococcus lenghuensis]|uniref:Cytidylate kinase n=1 Tax=Planococcus lenghuensis TaxID=2213202 RepID=A0A1Q2L3Z9_9BACL|nr:(d)CMP kinase [Planococcus lenghuensis]AQQ55104.1 cytidylate kinase [Planococcus lenghuensis]
MRTMQIAIDGPAAAGKSTVAKIVAEQLGFIYIDTGAMYRAATLKALTAGADLTDGEALSALLKNVDIRLEPGEQGQRVYLDGQDVTEEIRTDQVTKSVSEVAAHREIREQMVQLQKELAEGRGVVMDGRDIGTRVLQDAGLKVYMIASAEERAQRRFEENRTRGIRTPLDVLKMEIEKRDRMDSERKESPLVQAQDAVLIDTTSLTVPEVASRIIGLAKERLN